MVIGDDAVYISDKIDSNGNADIGIILPFGNYEGETITRDDAIQIIEHLKMIFSLDKIIKRNLKNA